ncbi:MAG: tryptophan--tRNA ligase, partial [Chloroflexi bacterium]
MSAQATTVDASPPSAKKTRKRILTGDRPTGPLHVGNYVGTLANRVKLQDSYDTFLLVADHHMLTTRLDHLSEIEQNIRDDVIDNLAVGVDPEKVTYLLQSLVPQIPELHLYFSMLVSVPRVQRIPTLKEQLRDHELMQPT